MPKAAKTARKKAGRLFDRLRSSSRSQSPAPDHGLNVVPQTPLPPEQLAETITQPVQAIAELSTVQISSQIVEAPQCVLPDQCPISSAESVDNHDDASQEARPATIETAGSVIDEVTQIRCLPSNLSPGGRGQGPAILNNNQNMTYNFGRDVVNNNSVTNYIYLTEAEKDVLKTINNAIRKRFVPTALHETQSEDAGCLQGTRLGVLSMFIKWAQDDPMRIFWLAGLAGTGKTSIAVTLCRMLQNDHKVLFGGAFFCSRTANVVELTDARCIIPTLAVAFAKRSPRFASALAAELNTDSDSAFKPISGQVISLLQQPLTLSSLPSSIVFVIDALDECSDVDDVRRLLRAIAALECDTMVKFILTSRPETHISTSPTMSSDLNSVLRLHTIGTEEVTEDIRMYISDAFAKSSLARPWCSTAEIKMLAVLSDGLFIFASTIISYVIKVQSVKGRQTRLRTVLSAVQDSKVAMGPLHAMYDFVLTRASDTAEIEPEELEMTLKVLACILAARIPLSVSALADLLGLETDEVQEALQRLHALVHVPEDADQPGLRTLHASFGDYLFARNRIPTSLGNETLARGCLRVMSQRLHFNVSQSRSSYDPNSTVKPSSITVSLEYACMQWVYHIADMAAPMILADEIDQQFCQQFLFWLEIMSVLGRISQAAAILSLATSTAQVVGLSQFFRDARAFVASSSEAIERSAPHIYLSALPFLAKDSLVYRRFSQRFAGLISADTFGIDHHGGRTIMTLTGHTDSINSVTYSPDGRYIASVSADCTIRIWDTQSGEHTTFPLGSGNRSVHSISFVSNHKVLAAGKEGRDILVWDTSVSTGIPQRLHVPSDSAICVLISPNGVFIAAAWSDGTLRIWKAETGEQVISIEKDGNSSGEYGNRINRAKFSPAGDILASCFGNGTVRLRRSETGEPVGQPLVGHSAYICCLSFSPDGEMLASGSADRTVRLWETHTGKCIATLRGHPSSIASVQISPNGKLLVSASSDHNVRLWTVQENQEKYSSLVLKGHSDSVYSVAFSPDGLYIASASVDKTIRIWDASIGQTATQPLQAHDDKVYTLAILADGDFFISGSVDGSVRSWNAQTGEPMLPQPICRTGPVRCMAISANGHLVASASGDGTVSIWNAHTGDLVGDLIHGNESEVDAVQFSSDSRWLVSGSSDETVRIWDISTRQPSSISPLWCGTYVSVVTFSPDRQLVAAGDCNGFIYLWNTGSGQRLREPFDASFGPIMSISFSPAGTYLAYDTSEGIVRLLDTTTGQYVLSLEGHYNDICTIAFSSDGQLICAGSDDPAIYIWSAVTGERLVILHGHRASVMSVAFTPDMQSIVSGSADSTIRVWNVQAALTQSSDRDDDPSAIMEHAGLEDGWLVGQSEELLLWVPVEYRAFLSTPSCTMIIGQHRIVLTTGDTWHRGENWAACYCGASAE